jgi:hypothetical protein
LNTVGESGAILNMGQTETMILILRKNNFKTIFTLN